MGQADTESDNIMVGNGHKFTLMFWRYTAAFSTSTCQKRDIMVNQNTDRQLFIMQVRLGGGLLSNCSNHPTVNKHAKTLS